jgi:hypothetical protein
MHRVRAKSPAGPSSPFRQAAPYQGRVKPTNVGLAALRVGLYRLGHEARRTMQDCRRRPDWDQTWVRITPGRQVESDRGVEVDTTQDREVTIATRMRGTVRLVWLLVTLMVILLPMASAIPIDPSWIKGVYDDGDFDDVVSFLTSGTLEVPVLPAADLSPVFTSAPTEALPDQPISATPLLASHESRAPPLS